MGPVKLEENMCYALLAHGGMPWRHEIRYRARYREKSIRLSGPFDST